MSKLSSIAIKTESGGFSFLDVHSFEKRFNPVFYGSPYDEAISGRLRTNIRGTRLSFSLLYSKCLQPDTFVNVMNYIAQDMESGLAFVLAGESTQNMIKFVPDGGFLHRVQYANQIGRYVPKISFSSVEFFNTYSVLGAKSVDWRYINEGESEFYDYKTITDPGLLEEEEYGSI